MELFPKQDRLSSGPGSLIRLPFGIHRKDGRRYGFVTPGGEPLAPTIRDQIRQFVRPQTVPETVWTIFLETGQALTPKRRKRPHTMLQRGFGEGGEGRSAEAIKAAITAREFILRFV